MPQEEDVLRPLGAWRDPEDKRDIMFSSLVPATAAAAIPRKFSLRDDLWFKAYRQKYGSCVGGAGRYIIQFYRWKWHGEKILRSSRFIYGRSKEMDGHPAEEGTWPRVCLMGMMGNGAPALERWAENNPPSPTHDEFIKSPPEDIREEAIQGILDGGIARVTNFTELCQAIHEFGPVMVSLRVLDTYDNDTSDGIIKPSTGEGYRGNHENIAIGYDMDANNGLGLIELMNQWGETWFEDGFAWMPTNYDPAKNFPLHDMWSITNQINAGLTSGAPIELGYPVETPTPYVTQKFGARPEYYAQFGMKGHNGIDFRTFNIPGKYIIAADDGEVLSINHKDGAYGLSIRLRHSWGMSIYAHNSQPLIEPFTGGVATKVRKGQRIAIAGSTGTDAEHCHFGIRINGVKNPGFLDWVDPAPYFKKGTMTKFFRVQQGNKAGIMILEGFSGTLLFENDWAEYQKLLEISGLNMNSPVVGIPADGKFFRVEDHGKSGIMVIEGFSGTLLFENDWTQYQTLLAISGMSMANPLINIP